LVGKLGSFARKQTTPTNEPEPPPRVHKSPAAGAHISSAGWGNKRNLRGFSQPGKKLIAETVELG
jgi:hypothetical protein